MSTRIGYLVHHTNLEKLFKEMNWGTAMHMHTIEYSPEYYDLKGYVVFCDKGYSWNYPTHPYFSGYKIIKYPIIKEVAW